MSVGGERRYLRKWTADEELDFIRRWNDQEDYPMERMRARFNLSRAGIVRKASLLRNAGQPVITRVSTGWHRIERPVP